jgi:hypothetical protein
MKFCSATPLPSGDVVPEIQSNSKSSSKLEPEKDWTYHLKAQVWFW